MAGDDAVAGIDLVGEAEIAGAVGDETIEFDKTAGIEQEVEAFAGGELALPVLRGHPRLAPALFRECLTMVKFFEQLSRVWHGAKS